ncbi:hypothetical protein CTI12_AA024370 [Artemisia annua]|uniref:Uncharacterized protein n=1 Tax=Artemisia annua TaxID=35608 RepID=A0A2U1QJ04_ARTAN|nr:hypothetical protein CTI12_AA024370 [Artemisia annua]
MWKDKSPGVKILWVWTIGTAAVLVANVATSRVRDMNKILNAQDEPSSSLSANDNNDNNPQGVDTIITDDHVMDSSSLDTEK